MKILTQDELWRCFLDKEPTRKERRHIELWDYISLCRRYPLRALAEIGACALILALMFGALWLKEILVWVQGVIR